MGVSTRPQLDNKNHIGFLVVHPHLVGQAADRFEGVTAPREEDDQFVAFAGKSSEGTYVCESHPSGSRSSRMLSRAGDVWMLGQNYRVRAEHPTKEHHE